MEYLKRSSLKRSIVIRAHAPRRQVLAMLNSADLGYAVEWPSGFRSVTVWDHPGRSSALSVSLVDQFCTVTLCGRAGRLTAKHCGFGPGQGAASQQFSFPKYVPGGTSGGLGAPLSDWATDGTQVRYDLQPILLTVYHYGRYGSQH
jgi:hypothetical protein